MSGYFISWAEQNGRTTDLAVLLGLKPIFVERGKYARILPLRYLHQYRRTRRIVQSSNSSQNIFFMLPPAPMLLAARGRKRNSRSRFVFDLHTGYFYDPKWKWAATAGLRAMKSHHAIVTNEHLAQKCLVAGVSSTVLHDVINVSGEPVPTSRGTHILVPLSYANDEPVDELLKAASRYPELSFVLTGRPPAEVQSKAPANVHFPGFVSSSEYDALLRDSLAVMALTTRPHTMQRAGYEAMNFGVPLITSNFPELFEFFESSAIYASPDADSLSDAIGRAQAESEHLRDSMVKVRRRRQTEQSLALDNLRKLLR
ncbi:glycosyltransferase [Microbacterium sp. JC 701]|uniref:glycosyltransferase n=1 Tax=Microbacterium sp. JC 701 TaxID=2897389 RepID=UPI001E34961F|nr:glycosyltransferase [Microbacterium sp. JC 701]MCD2170215.1 glycosyltransferase [Microbacterium sp. JC 701]